MSAHTLRTDTPQSAGMDAEQLERTAAYVQRAVDEDILPLADVLVARRGRIVLHRSFVNDKVAGDGHRLEPDSLFYLASFTKPMVATLVMQQVERGTISLARPVADYIPEFGQRGKEQVTVRHLLCHASGLPDALTVPVTHVASNDEFLEMICAQPLVFEPGTRCTYCTWGFAVLAEIVRRVTEQELEPLGRRLLFDPLGMADTHFGWDEGWDGRIITCFNSDLQQHEDVTPESMAMLRGDTGAYSRALDLAAFCQMMLNGGSYNGARILSPLSVQRMIESQYPWWDTPERLSGDPDVQFHTLSKGLGWQMRGDNFFRGSDLMSSRAFFHGGALTMRAIADPESELITVFMTSIMATGEGVSAYFGQPGQVSHTFGTMAFAAVSEL